MSADWTPQDLDTIGSAGEIEITPIGADGAPRAGRTIWIVRYGDGLYVRSYRGPGGGWYRAARRSGRARIRGGGFERDVTVTPHDRDRAGLDDAYRSKYGRSSYVDAMVTDSAAATTLRLTPA
jgi:hypothetical protein